MRETFDICISGGGIAGLSAAAAFGTAGFSVLVVDPAPPVTDGADPSADRRSTAFLQPARNTLAAAGIWPRLAPFAAPLQIMRLADAGGEPGVIRQVADFDASEISDQPFGWNLPNWLLRREMTARLSQLQNVDFRPGVATKRITQRTDHALLALSDGSQVQAPLVLAADGRNSFIRDAVGIGVNRWSYGQRAMVFAVRHPDPSDGVSTEIHRTGGPFTLVPLPDTAEGPVSAVVWMERTDKTEALMALDADTFSIAATERSCACLGKLELCSPRAIWPIIAMQAKSLTGERVALMAEAAHVVPPIGAQGLNMSLGDIDALLQLAQDAPDQLGSPTMLAAYSARRTPDITARVRGVDALNRAAMAEGENLRALRLKGLQWLHGLTPVRRVAMRAGLGA
ncbi:MAG: UbiH/UbiF family hydroxylase [Pseudomonadota bacterium]